MTSPNQTARPTPFPGLAAPPPRTPRTEPTRPELWGGLECSVVQIGPAMRDQFRETGHHDRIADLEAVASLGLTRLRYPISWERIAPSQPDECDWSWHDER